MLMNIVSRAVQGVALYVADELRSDSAVPVAAFDCGHGVIERFKSGDEIPVDSDAAGAIGIAKADL